MGNRYDDEDKFAHYDPELDRMRQSKGANGYGSGRPSYPPAKTSGYANYDPELDRERPRQGGAYGSGPPASSGRQQQSSGQYPSATAGAYKAPPPRQGGASAYGMDARSSGRGAPPLPYIDQETDSFSFHPPPRSSSQGPSSYGRGAPEPAGYGRGGTPRPYASQFSQENGLPGRGGSGGRGGSYGQSSYAPFDDVPKPRPGSVDDSGLPGRGAPLGYGRSERPGYYDDSVLSGRGRTDSYGPGRGGSLPSSPKQGYNVRPGYGDDNGRGRDSYATGRGSGPPSRPPPVAAGGYGRSERPGYDDANDLMSGRGSRPSYGGVGRGASGQPSGGYGRSERPGYDDENDDMPGRDRRPGRGSQQGGYPGTERPGYGGDDGNGRGRAPYAGAGRSSQPPTGYPGTERPMYEDESRMSGRGRGGDSSYGPGRGGGPPPLMGAGRYAYDGLDQQGGGVSEYDDEYSVPPAPISSEVAHQVYASVFSDPAYGGAVQFNQRGLYSEEPERLQQQHHKEDVLRYPDQY